MAEICKPGDPVKWSTLYELMSDIMQDAAGEYSDGKENDPQYNKTLDEKSPFYLEEVYQATMAFHMWVEGNTVDTAYIAENPGSSESWDLPDPLKTLAENDRLYFVAEADGCWCNTLWKVLSLGENYTLERVESSAKMACQSIDVPTSGTTIPCDFVPQGAWANMQRRAYSARLKGEQTWPENKCLELGGLIYSTAGGHVQWVQRTMTGYFTWSIAKDDFDQIMTAMDNVFIQWPCGYEKSKWWHDYDTDGVHGAGQKREEDEAGPLNHDWWQAVWAWTSKLLATSDSAWSFANKPGCLELALQPYVYLKYPWYEATCGDTKRCPDQQDKLLVRCTTLQVIDALVKRLKKTGVRTKCTASLRYYNSYQTGTAQACSLGANDAGDGYYTVGTATNSCSADDIHFQDCDIVETMSGGIRAWGGTDPPPPNTCSIETDDGCADLFFCSDDPADFSYTKTGGGSSASVLSAAQSAAGAAGWVDGTGTLATMTVGNGTINGNPYYGGTPFVVSTYAFSASSGPSAASYSKYRLKIEAVDLPAGHVFKIVVKQQRNSYDEFGNPTTELLAKDTHTIGPGETYTEETPEENDVFLTAEIWHDKAPTSGT